MIILHKDKGARIRLDRIAGRAVGAVHRCSGDQDMARELDRISQWLKSATRPELIIVDKARAGDRHARENYQSLRRSAKFAGVDVHLDGDDTLEFIADHVVTCDEEEELTAPGSKVGAEIARLLASEQMTELKPAAIDIPTVEEIVAMSGCTEQQARDRIGWLESQKILANNLYQVNVSYFPGDRAHIMIRRLDRQPIQNWGHFQQIKNQVLGKEC